MSEDGPLGEAAGRDKYAFPALAEAAGRLLAAADGPRIAAMEVSGWDTHVAQVARLEQPLRQLDAGLGALKTALGPAWQRTAVLAVTEFGRTARVNGDKGTDHGHGSVYWALGGGINGGRIAGEQVKVEQAALFQNRDYPVLTDYRALFAGLTQKMFGLQPQSIQRVFGNTRPADLGLV